MGKKIILMFATIVACFTLYSNSAEAQCPVPIAIDVLSIDCNDATQTFTVSVQVSGGLGSSYTIGGTLFNVNTDEVGNPFIIGPLPDGQSFFIEASDAAGCVDTYQSGDVTCSKCPSDIISGMPTGPLNVCTGSVSAQASTIAISDTSFVTYVLHTSSGLPTNSSVVSSNPAGIFNAGGALANNTQYYISPVVGVTDNNGDGIPDFDHECTTSLVGTPVMFTDGVSISFNNSDCDNTTSQGIFTLNVNGSPGVTYTISGIISDVVVGSGTVTVGPLDDGVSFSVTATGGGCSNTYTGLVDCEKTPVEWASFTGEAKENGNFIKWVTATEFENDHFLVESSTDGVNFNTIETIAGVGNSLVANAYEYLDKDALSGVTYYRITQVDLNGDTSSTQVLSLTRGEVTTSINRVVTTTTSVMVVATIAPNANTQLMVTDLAGRTIIHQTVEAQEGLQTIALNAGELTSGLYLVTLTDGNNVTTAKFVK